MKRLINNNEVMMEKLLVWRIYSTADVFGVKFFFLKMAGKDFLLPCCSGD
jgi:hypothetical protein